METRDVGPLIGSIDCGTSSARFMVYSATSGELIAFHQISTEPIYPKQGWVEQDCNHILKIVNNSIEKTIDKLKEMNIDPSSIKGIGITNQRESTIAWHKETGQPLYNAIIWSDGRTREIVDDFLDQIPDRDFNYYKERTGLPISTYFTAFKVKWLLQNVLQVKKAMEEQKLLLGTIDSWLLWNLCGIHATDVTNASRTFLMNIETLEWDEHLCNKVFGIPASILPKIKSSASNFGTINSGPLKGLPVTGVIGDQHSALVGHHCLSPGQIKSTYGTGCFILQNLGSCSGKKALSGISNEAKKSLIVTVAYKLENQPAVYALEGSIAVVGASMVWLRDNIGLINDFNEIESLSNQVNNSGGVYFVPAFQGLFAPYWDLSASGLFIGLSQFTRKAHLVRAMLESVAFQTTDILSLMKPSSSGLKVDGGMVTNNSLCQIISDLNAVKVIRPSKIEATALGCAMIAGHTLGLWDFEKNHYKLRNKLDKLVNDRKPDSDIKNTFDKIDQDDQLAFNSPLINGKYRDRNFSLHRSSMDDSMLYPNSSIFKPQIDSQVRREMIFSWNRAVKRSMGWTENKGLEVKKVNYLQKSGLSMSLLIISSMAMFIFGRYIAGKT